MDIELASEPMLDHHDLAGAGHSSVANQVNPAQPLANATAYQVRHLGEGIAGPVVVASRCSRA